MGASIAEIKKELSHLREDEITKLILALAKFKKENKEYLDYLLFSKHLGPGQAFEGLQEIFTQVNASTPYLAKKTIRKALRHNDKYIKFSDNTEEKIELAVSFCKLFLAMPKIIQKDMVIQNIYLRRVEKINKWISGLHEDLQYDYKRMLEDLK